MSSIDTQHEILVLLLMALHAMPVSARRTSRFNRLTDDDSWSTNYLADWIHDRDNGDVKQITIERKVPVPIFVEKIRHVPVPITKPIYIEKTAPIVHIVPRSQNYHHHHFTEYHHLH